MDIKELHEKILKMIEGGIEWEKQPFDEHPEAMGYTGTFESSWRFVVASFDVQGQKGYDGAATDLQNGRVIHLPRPTAEVLVQDAEKAVQ